MGYPIEPLLWDDEKFVGLTRLAKLLWLYLLTGRCRSRLPGLIATETFIIARRLREPLPEVEEAMSALCQAGMVQLDDRLQLIRVPNAPRYAGKCPNPNILRSWYRIWRELPPSTLKFEHLGVLFQHCVAAGPEAVRAEWARSFQLDQDAWENRNSSANSSRNGSGNSSANSSRNGLNGFPLDQDQDQDQDLDQDPTVSETVSETVPEAPIQAPKRSEREVKSPSISQKIATLPPVAPRVATVAELRRQRDSVPSAKKG